MVSSEPLLKTQQVARALGVSGATVKRWVDSGIICAVRTVGKHRLVPISEVKRIAAQIGTVAPQGMNPSDPDGGSSRIRDSRAVETLTNLLRDGNAEQARAFIRAVFRSGRTGAELADRLIGPVMERIGHGWMVGSLDVYHEHLATSIVAAAIRERIDELGFQASATAPVAVGATSEGDFYVMPGLLAELLLRESGWNVRNLGTNLPLRSLANATREFRPAMVFISINHVKDEDRFIREYLAFYEAAEAVDAAVILGGRALRPELRSQLPYAAFGDRMSHLAEFARRLTHRANSPDAAPPSDPTATDGPATRSSEHHE